MSNEYLGNFRCRKDSRTFEHDLLSKSSMRPDTIYTNKYIQLIEKKTLVA